MRRDRHEVRFAAAMPMSVATSSMAFQPPVTSSLAEQLVHPSIGRFVAAGPAPGQRVPRERLEAARVPVRFRYWGHT
jgi:hypothetical protein